MYVKNFYKLIPRWIPMRVVICVMTFTACWTSYMCRLQMPILAVPMIKAVESNGTGGYCNSQGAEKSRSSVPTALKYLDPGAYLENYILEDGLSASESFDLEAKDVRYPRQDSSASHQDARPPDAPITLVSGKPFAWDPYIRGQLIASYSYGNVPGNFLGGLMTLKWGAKKSILWTSLLAAVMSLVSPLLAQLHWTALMISRIIIGLTGGVTFPACHHLVAKWAPPQERARFVWSLLGGTFGTILTYPMVAAIAEHLYWENAWYIPSLMMLFWVLVFALLAYDSPEEHPGITDEEKEFIISAQAGTVASRKPTMKETPMKAIFTSVPFISLIICHFGNLFLLFFYQNAMMLYLTKALGFQLTKGGAVAALPWAGRMIFGFFFSWFGDTVKKRDLMTLTKLRKLATIFSHVVPGIFLIGVGYVGCNLLLANVFLFLALGFNGAASIANLSNNQDLSPNFAGFLYGIMNMIGCTAGIIISPMVEEIAGKHGNPIDKWQILFWIGAAVCILCMIIFVIGGSGNIQKWNEVPAKETPEEADPKETP